MALRPVELKLNVPRVYHNLYCLLVLGLIVFGQNFSKFQVVGPLYLHDLLLVLCVLPIALHPPRKLPFIPVLIVVLTSVIYLIFSLVISSASLELTIRQYALFAYLFCYYLMFIQSNPLGEEDKFVPFLIKLGVACVLIQVVFIAYRVYRGLSVIEDYNYFSPATVLGLIIGAAYVLVYVRHFVVRYATFLFVLLLSTTTGHSSAFLAVFVAGVFYFFFRTSNRSRIFILAAILLSVFLLYVLLPQFQDYNAGFRLIAWQYTLRNAIVENYGLIGEGFGVPYFDETLVYKLFNEVGSEVFFGATRAYEPYLSSVHNSFLTIIFAIGLLPGLLIFYPFVKMGKYLIHRKENASKQADFLFLSLIGLSVWVSFNQILEVPHSTALFWMVYFSCLVVRVEFVDEKYSKINL
ncbi:MAG: hypothetical protein ACOYXT_27425 [Bacteroidota bacterium]